MGFFFQLLPLGLGWLVLHGSGVEIEYLDTDKAFEKLSLRVPGGDDDDDGGVWPFVVIIHPCMQFSCR